jgi:electron transport complex protein RnfC
VIRGIRLEGKKDATLLVWTLKRFDPPAQVRIPIGNNLTSVNPGDKVKAGDLIAEPANAQSVAVHASISGTVTAVRSSSHPFFDSAEAVEIESDKQDLKCDGFGTERAGWDKLSSEELLSLFQSHGLVNLGAEMVPVHVKAAAQVSKLIINACEPEPYLTCEHALMMSHPVEILKGAEILRKAMGAEQVLIVTQDNKTEAAELLKSKIYFQKWKHFEVQIIPSVYPAGTDPMLRRQFGHEPIEIFNAATAYAVHEAVVFQKPLIERPVTVGGECFIEPKNVWARLGTEFETLVKYARGFLRQPGKVVAGGPMTGKAQGNLKASLVPGLPGLLALPEETVKEEETHSCIRSGRCVEVCPVEISPVMITLAAERGLFQMAAEYGADACIQCGNCTYICPTKRPMAEWLRMAQRPPAKAPRLARRVKKKILIGA